MKKVVWECDSCKFQVIAGTLPSDWVIVEVSGGKQVSITFHWCKMCWEKIKGETSPPVRKIKLSGGSVSVMPERVDEDDDLIVVDEDEDD